MHPLLVNSSDLDAWARRRDAQSTIPQLLRRLIFATVDRVEHLSFPAHEGVQLGGYDGRLHVGRGNAFAPDGHSVWEFGVSRDSKKKADDDYEKRTGDPGEVPPDKSTFIFVTPRRWGSKDAWIAARNKVRTWHEVRAYDADDLETWLETAPAVHAWVSALIGKRPEGIQDLSTFWDSWSAATTPPTSAALMTAGRDAEVERLRHWLSEDPSAISVQAESRVASIAVLAAAIDGLPTPEKEAILSRSVIVSDPGAWDSLVSSDGSLLLIPIFPDRSLAAAAAARGHHVYLPLGPDEAPASVSIAMPRPARKGLAAALEEMGLKGRRADDLALIGRRSPEALRRRLAVTPGALVPEWARPAYAREVVPAMLAGSWEDESAGDQAALERLSGRPYQELAGNLVRWANEPDPPTRLVANAWLLASKEDAWDLLQRHLSGDDIKRFIDCCVEILGEVDTRFDLPTDQRWLGSIFGKGSTHSGKLRNGIADTLAFLAARSEALQIPQNGQEVASHVAATVLTRANKDWRLWASLSPVLPLLAEAAPAEFLAVVRSGLRGEEPVLRALFTDDEASHLSSSPHTGLLWALEGLAWNPDYLSEASALLARLAEVDPGGKTLNRPANSLKEIFLSWYPGTTANLEERMRVLDRLRAQVPDVAWAAMLQCLPESQGIAFLTHKPQWREWVPDDPVRITVAQVHDAAERLSERLLADVAGKGSRWRHLLGQHRLLPLPYREEFGKRLASEEIQGIEADEREKLRDELRDFITRHRRYSDAAWAVPEAELEPLQKAYELLEPRSPAKRNAWLFTRRAAWEHDGETRETRRENLEIARNAAVREVYADGGLDALIHFANEVEDPWAVGASVGLQRLVPTEAVIPKLLPPENLSARAFASGFIASRFQSEGWTWADGHLAEGEAERWSSELAGAFLTALPFDSGTWDRSDDRSPDTQRAYWSMVIVGGVADSEIERVIRSLLQFGRAVAALDLLCNSSYDRSLPIPPELVADTIERALEEGGDARTWHSLAYGLAELLDKLTQSGGIEEDRLVRLELSSLPLLEYRKTPLLFHKEMARAPDFFAEVVKLVYRPEKEEPEDPAQLPQLDAEESARTRTFSQLLDSWREVPGRQPDGSIQPDLLKDWTTGARNAVSAADRGAVGNLVIGRTLARVPDGDDGNWPHEAVREIIDAAQDENLEGGIETAVYNSRGVVTRNPDEGGIQERKLAERYLGYARGIGTEWPVTGAMLRRIAERYSAQARREDARAELRQDVGN